MRLNRRYRNYLKQRNKNTDVLYSYNKGSVIYTKSGLGRVIDLKLLCKELDIKYEIFKNVSIKQLNQEIKPLYSMYEVKPFRDKFLGRSTSLNEMLIKECARTNIMRFENHCLDLYLLMLKKFKIHLKDELNNKNDY